MQKQILIIDGSVRAHGNTSYLVNRLVGKFNHCIGTHVHMSNSTISPCKHCGGCKKSGVCVIDDDMRILYERFLTSDYVVLASPVIFGNVSGNFLNVFSRLQCFFKEYKVLPKVGKEKKGAVILTAGGSGDVAGAEKSMRIFMKMLNVVELDFVGCYTTDSVAASEDRAVLDKVDSVRKQWLGE